MNLPARMRAAVKPAVVAAAGLSAYFCVTLLAWHRIDQRPPRWDESHYLLIAAHSYQSLQKHDLLGALSVKGVSDTKPGLVPFLSALSYRFVGESEKRAAFLVNGLSMALVCVTLLHLGKRLSGRIGVGTVAWLLFCNLPVAAHWACYYTVDLALTAAVCATVSLCLALDESGLQGWGRAALLGLTVAVGMGTKHLYVVFAAGPLALLFGRALVRSVRPPRLGLRGRWPLVALVGCGVLLGMLYHALNFHVIREQWLRSQSVQRAGGSASPSPWPCLVYLFECPPIPAVAFLFAAGLGLIVLGCRRQWNTLYAVLAIAGGTFGVARASSYPLTYYFLPLAPLVCLLACCPLALPLPARWDDSRAGKAVRAALTGTAVVVLLCCHTKQMFGTANPVRVAGKLPGIFRLHGRLTVNPVARRDYWTHCIPDGNVGALPYPQHWPIREMLDDVVRAVDAGPYGRWRKFSVGSFTGAHEYLSVDLQNFKIWQMHANDFLIAYPVPVEPAGRSSLAGLDFLLLKTGAVCKDDFVGRPAENAVQAGAASLTADNYRRLREQGFTLLGKYELPDGSEGTVWRLRRLDAW